MKAESRKVLVIGIYNHPEVFPPTLNAINILAEDFDEIHVVYRPNQRDEWRYPGNVFLHKRGGLVSVERQMNATVFRKLWYFLLFTYTMLGVCLSRKPAVVLVYDVYAMLAYLLVRPVTRKHLWWYHSHDFALLSSERKFSLGWFACKQERKRFPDIDIFSLPSEERVPYFPLEKFAGKLFVIPNYPARSVYDAFYGKPEIRNEIVLIFQGRISPGHGLEEIIPCLAHKVNGKRLCIRLKGFCSEAYKETLTELARVYSVQDRLSFYGYSSYSDVPRLASESHIGIAVFAGKDLMNQTMGRASNKVFEYAAVGLPVIYKVNTSVGNALQEYEWAVGLELTMEDILGKLSFIDMHYRRLSDAAVRSFRDSLNYESVFEEARSYMKRLMQQA